MLLIGLAAQPGSAALDAPAVKRQLSRWVNNGSVLLHDEQGRVLLEHDSERLLVPASIVKIYTALVALDLLGADYRFKTEILISTGGDLGIKGWGDPQLISEEIHLIAEEVRGRGFTQIRRIRLDQSSFANTIRVEGQSNSLNPYDAINSALIVNFNTVFLGRRNNGEVYSAEPVTPLTPLSRELGKTLKPGTRDRFNLSTEPINVSRYAGELFAAILRDHGVTVLAPGVGTVSTGETWSPVYTHYNTATLEQVIRGLLKYSNNLIANQIYLVAGAESQGYPATMEKARSVFQAGFAMRFPEHAARTIIDEASGISRKNRMNAASMMAVLEAFRPWARLLDTKKGALVKSGTLTGVYNYAGYIPTNKGLRPFVIMLNQTRNTRDLILKMLKKFSK